MADAGVADVEVFELFEGAEGFEAVVGDVGTLFDHEILEEQGVLEVDEALIGNLRSGEAEV